MKKIKKLAVLAMVAGMLTPVFADSSTQALNISTEVVPTCVTLVDSNLSVNYNPDTINYSDVNIGITCTVGTTYSMELSAGNSGDETNRFMESSSGDKLKYKISYMGDLLWGTGANKLTSVGTGTGEVFAGSLLVEAGQYVAPGTYSDTLRVSLTY